MLRCLAFLPDPAASRRLSAATALGDASSESASVRFAADWEEMNRLALREPAHVAVFDPYATGELDLRSCAEFAEAFPSIPMFAYGAFPGHFAEDVFQMARQIITVKGGNPADAQASSRHGGRTRSASVPAAVTRQNTRAPARRKFPADSFRSPSVTCLGIDRRGCGLLVLFPRFLGDRISCGWI